MLYILFALLSSFILGTATEYLVSHDEGMGFYWLRWFAFQLLYLFVLILGFFVYKGLRYLFLGARANSEAGLAHLQRLHAKAHGLKKLKLAIGLAEQLVKRGQDLSSLDLFSEKDVDYLSLLPANLRWRWYRLKLELAWKNSDRSSLGYFTQQLASEFKKKYIPAFPLVVMTLARARYEVCLNQPREALLILEEGLKKVASSELFLERALISEKMELWSLCLENVSAAEKWRSPLLRVRVLTLFLRFKVNLKLGRLAESRVSYDKLQHLLEKEDLFSEYNYLASETGSLLKEGLT